MADIRIPDVSDYQGAVNWPQVLASGRAGGICKATESTNYVAETFAANWVALDRLGATRGAYHFARPGDSGATIQAQKFLAAVGTWKGTDLLVLDLEVGDGNLSGWALEWLGTVQRLTGGIVPWVYSYGPFIRQHLDDARLAAFPLWLAAYQANRPTCPPPWKAYHLWQHTDKANIPGISGPCDESVGTLPAVEVAVAAPTAPVVVSGPVHDFEENTVKTVMMHIGPLDGNGCGWASWDPGLGRDPNVVAITLLGPNPPTDGYWDQQGNVTLAAQPRGGTALVTVRNGKAGDTVTCWVTVS
jgi:lysozyme